jgi:hypothetical protein
VAARLDPSLQLLARFGFLARGVVYVVVGAVAARVAVLQRGRTAGPGGALRRILELEHGRAALATVAAGLFAFVVFRLVQASASQGLSRFGYVVGAVGALVLAVSAAALLAHARREGTSPFRALGAQVMAHPLGWFGLVLGGAGAAVAGAVEALRALLGRLPRDYEAAVLPRERKLFVARLARVGVLAHGAVVATVGVSLLRAAFRTDPDEILGTGGAIRTLRRVSSPVVFGVVAAGLLAYGVSLLLLAAHRRKRL